MKPTLLIPACAVVVAVLAASLGTPARTSDPPASASTGQWEYLVVAGGNTNLSPSGSERLRKVPDGAFSREAYPLERNLDKLGAEGWELVAVVGAAHDPTFYLKRPKVSR